MKGTIGFLASLVLLSSFGYGTIGPCGSCPGCLTWWKKVPASIKKIEESYHAAEKKSSKYYLTNIVPLELVMVISERMITRMIAKIEMVDRLNILLRQEMIREMEKQKELRSLFVGFPSK